jgi:hypothetical protein
MVISIMIKKLVTINLTRPNRILRGRFMTKPNRRNLNLAQSSFIALDGPSLVTWSFIFLGHSLFVVNFFCNSLFVLLYFLGLSLFVGLFRIGFCLLCPFIYWTLDFLHSNSFGGLGLFAFKFFLGLGHFAF